MIALNDNNRKNMQIQRLKNFVNTLVDDIKKYNKLAVKYDQYTMSTNIEISDLDALEGDAFEKALASEKKILQELRYQFEDINTALTRRIEIKESRELPAPKPRRPKSRSRDSDDFFSFLSRSAPISTHQRFLEMNLDHRAELAREQQSSTTSAVIPIHAEEKKLDELHRSYDDLLDCHSANYHDNLLSAIDEGRVKIKVPASAPSSFRANIISSLEKHSRRSGTPVNGFLSGHSSRAASPLTTFAQSTDRVSAPSQHTSSGSDYANSSDDDCSDDGTMFKME